MFARVGWLAVMAVLNWPPALVLLVTTTPPLTEVPGPRVPAGDRVRVAAVPFASVMAVVWPVLTAVSTVSNDADVTVPGEAAAAALYSA